MFYHQCSVTNIDTLNVYNRKFLKCLLSSDIPPFILAQLVDDPGVRNSEGSGRLTMLVDYMVEKYTTQLCGSINHLDYNMFNTYDLFQVCKGMNFGFPLRVTPFSDAECQTGDDAPSTLYLFTGERFPAKCALSNECRQEFTHFKLAPVKSCDPEKNQRCNIMGLTNDECTAAPASCVVCEDPLSCKVVPGLTTRAECEGAQVCVDHLGNLHLGVSEAECRALYGACYYNDETKFPVLDPLATGFTEYVLIIIIIILLTFFVGLNVLAKSVRLTITLLIQNYTQTVRVFATSSSISTLTPSPATSCLLPLATGRPYTTLSA